MKLQNPTFWRKSFQSQDETGGGLIKIRTTENFLPKAAAKEPFPLNNQILNFELKHDTPYHNTVMMMRRKAIPMTYQQKSEMHTQTMNSSSNSVFPQNSEKIKPLSVYGWPS